MPRKLVKFPSTSKGERAGISPELKSWIRNAIVRALVREFLTEKQAPISLAPQRVEVLETEPSTVTAERFAE